MTTFAQWRSPGRRLDLPEQLVREPKSYDMRVVDRFYAYCQAVAQTEVHRADVGQSRRTGTRVLWAVMIAAGALGYYLLDRLTQVAPLFY